MVCIVYALIGIPLTLMFLANIGEVMADIFRFVYAKVFCCGCLRGRRNKNKSESRLNLKEEEADVAKGHDAWKEQYGGKTAGPVVQDDPEGEDEDGEDEQISVPLTCTLALIAAYLFMGALLFGVWEGWDSLKAAYYCFITIATIGFGDVVPGTDDFASLTGQMTMIGAACYMVFGMAIMSMAFNLIQDEMLSKFVWIAEKLGKHLSNKRDPQRRCPREFHEAAHLFSIF